MSRRKGAAARRAPGKNAWVVGREAGIDLAHFLAENLPGSHTVRAMRRHLERGVCRVDGQVETFGSRKLRKGEVVECPPPRAEATGRIRFESSRVLHDADGLLVYDKPPGLAATPVASGKAPDLESLAGDAVGPVKAVHRLDADTSGLVLLARDLDLARRLEAAFRSRDVTKTYLALVRGVPRDEGEHRSFLVLKRSQPGMERWASGRGSDAKEALTRWRVLDKLSHLGALVKVEPLTGRHHQIRIHFAEMGHPLLGDRTYGDRRDPVSCTRHMLHAGGLALTHPETGEPLRFRAPAPKDFNAAKAALKSA